MSGHSKFANIKHKKEKNDAKKGKIFTMLGREIQVAVKAGGPDPAVNGKLRDVIAKCKANNMPNDTIDRSIKKAAGGGEDVEYENVTYEGYGPNGVAVIVEVLTDNRNRAAANVRNAFTKGGGNMGNSGCVSFMFDEKGLIVIDKEEIDRINQICENHKKENEKLNNLFIVTYAHNYFSLKQSQINKPAIQIDRHYNNDFAPVAAEIENFLLEENKSGLIILHGKQGTGKTTYIRHLINLGKKRMIYMSGDLVDKLSDPSFITFIRQQKNSIFIVEDCEELLSSRNGGNRMNAGLVNILNISDGLLSDELCIKFICTFNAPLKDIDEALLRKGRLAARYEFKDLTTDKVNQLIKEEGLDIPQQTQPMTLAEIYNYEGMDFSLGRKRVGF